MNKNICCHYDSNTGIINCLLTVELQVVKIIDVSTLTTETSRLQYIVADYTADGRVFIYISDGGDRAIVVFDVTSGRGYRVILPNGIALGCARRDVLYMNLIHRPNGDNSVVFTYLSSNHLFSVRSYYLQYGTVRGNIVDLGPKESRYVFLGTDNGSNIFFRKEGESDIYRWDLSHYPVDNEVQKVYEGTSWALPTQVVPDYKRGRMRVLESNFPDFFHDNVGFGAHHSFKLF